MATQYSEYGLNRNIIMHVNVLDDNESGSKLKLALKGKEANSVRLRVIIVITSERLETFLTLVNFIPLKYEKHSLQQLL